MRNRFWFGWFVASLEALSSVALLGTSAWLISRASQQPAEVYLAIAVVGVRTFALSKAFFRYSQRLLLHDITFREIAQVRVSLFKSLAELSPIGFESKNAGGLISNIVEDVEGSMNEKLRFRTAFIQIVVTMLAGSIFYLWLAPKFFLPITLLFLISFALSWIASNSNAKSFVKELGDLRVEQAVAIERMVNRSKFFQAYEIDGLFKDESKSISVKANVKQVRVALGSGLVTAIILGMMYLAVGSVVFYLDAERASVDVVLVSALVLLPLGVYEYLQQSPQAHQARQQSLASKSRLGELSSANQVSELRDGGKPIERFNTLRFRDVRVTVANGSALSLPDFDLNAGQSLALFGPSGAGKSTIGSLLLKFRKPSSGSILVNSEEIAEISEESLRSKFLMFEQKPKVLAGSLRENLLIAKPDANDTELEDCLNVVELWGTFSNRSGLDAQILPNGSNLSGGEIARIAIARLILARPEVLVLDEPTASIEKSLAKKIVEKLLATAKSEGGAVVLITHDVDLLKLVDKVINVPSK